MQDVHKFADATGIQNSILVQPSIYGTDNSCLLEGLRQLDDRSRGVVVIDPDKVDEGILRDWNDQGVTGVRINLKSEGQVLTANELVKTLVQHANLIQRFNWFIDLHIPLDMAPILETIIPKLGVNVCFDHFGCPDIPSIAWHRGNSLNLYDIPGFTSLISVLRGENTFIKMSAPYRINKDPEMRDVRAIATELLLQAPERVIYASDWPHTRFEGYDARPFTRMIQELCESDPGLAGRVFRYNTERLLSRKKN